MTLILKPELDTVKIYHHTNIEVSMSKVQMFAQTDTDTQTDIRDIMEIFPYGMQNLIN